MEDKHETIYLSIYKCKTLQHISIDKLIIFQFICCRIDFIIGTKKKVISLILGLLNWDNKKKPLVIKILISKRLEQRLKGWGDRIR